jgi:hypothetical protein
MPTDYEADVMDQAKGLLADTDPNAPAIPDEVWDAALKAALPELSNYRPLNKPLVLDVATDADAVLPDDFVSIDPATFANAIAPGVRYSYQNFVFVFESTVSAASDLRRWPDSVPFSRGTIFSVVGSNGARSMHVSPAPISATKLSFVYRARHQVTTDIDTVPAGDKDLLVMKMCHLACRSMAFRTVADKSLSQQLMVVAKSFKDEFDDRTKFAVVGMKA